MNSVIWNSASVIDGMTSDFNPDAVRKPVVHPPSETVVPRPYAGSQLSSTEKIRIRMMPVRNDGTEMPTSETTCSTCAGHALRLMPAYTPIGMPTQSASSAAHSASSSVAGTRENNTRPTGSRLRYEIPKSPRTASPR